MKISKMKINIFIVKHLSNDHFRFNNTIKLENLKSFKFWQSFIEFLYDKMNIILSTLIWFQDLKELIVINLIYARTF